MLQAQGVTLRPATAIDMLIRKQLAWDQPSFYCLTRVHNNDHPQTIAWILHLNIHSSFEQNHNITNRIACCCFLWHVLCLLFIRVDIPVIIMGETGCGKTKLIEFMSKLQTPTDLRDTLTTMIIVKVRCIKLNSISWHAPSFASYHIKSSSGFI